MIWYDIFFRMFCFSSIDLEAVNDWNRISNSPTVFDSFLNFRFPSQRYDVRSYSLTATCALLIYKYVRLRGRPYIHTCRSYVHTPRARFHERRNWTELTYIVRCRCALADSFVRFWASGGAKFPKWEIPCPGCPWTTVQNLTPLASSSAEKYVTVQTDKITKLQTNKRTNEQTATVISTFRLSACVDNK